MFAVNDVFKWLMFPANATSAPPEARGALMMQIPGWRSSKLQLNSPGSSKEISFEMASPSNKFDSPHVSL